MVKRVQEIVENGVIIKPCVQFPLIRDFVQAAIIFNESLGHDAVADPPFCRRMILRESRYLGVRRFVLRKIQIEQSDVVEAWGHRSNDDERYQTVRRP